MELEVITKKENPVLRRDIIQMRMKYDLETPSRDDVKKAVAKKVNSKPECVSIKQINTHFGSKAAELYVYVYDEEKDRQAIEPKHIYERIKVEEKKEEEKSAEAKTEGEAPAAEKQEETEAAPETKEAEKPAEEKKEEKPEGEQ